MKKEFSLEEKLEAISLVFQGESARSVSDRLHLGHHLLYEWLEANMSGTWYLTCQGIKLGYGRAVAIMRPPARNNKHGRAY